MAKTAAKPPASAVDQVETFDVDQNSPEWFTIRLGLMTSSNFSKIMASGVGGGESVGRHKLMYQLAGEILTGKPAETYRNADMDRGNSMEAEAIDYYAKQTFDPVTKIGFVKRTVQPFGMGQSFVVGCSPDALVGADGLVQVKTMKPELLIDVWKSTRYPTEHMAQQQGEMWVTGRRWNDLQLFYSDMPIAPKFRIERDDSYIARLSEECERFSWELDQLVAKLREAGGG